MPRLAISQKRETRLMQVDEAYQPKSRPPEPSCWRVLGAIASTLLVKQHIAIDVFTGVLYAKAGLVLAERLLPTRTASRGGRRDALLGLD